jgi:hypothetical protein
MVEFGSEGAAEVAAVDVGAAEPDAVTCMASCSCDTPPAMSRLARTAPFAVTLIPLPSHVQPVLVPPAWAALVTSWGTRLRVVPAGMPVLPGPG